MNVRTLSSFRFYPLRTHLNMNRIEWVKKYSFEEFTEKKTFFLQEIEQNSKTRLPTFSWFSTRQTARVLNTQKNRFT